MKNSNEFFREKIDGAVECFLVRIIFWCGSMFFSANYLLRRFLLFFKAVFEIIF